MRMFLLAMLTGAALSAPAQQAAQKDVPPPAGSNWGRVQALPMSTSIYVNAHSRTTRCTLTSVDADTLTCTRGKAITFQRSDIASVKLPRHTRSTLIAAGIGAGVGALVVKAVAATIFGEATNGKAKGSVYAGGAGLGAVVFGSIGYLTDDARSTVYKAP